MKLSDYIDWLKKEASNNDVVKAYVESRTEEQIYNDLAFILKSVRFTPTGAVNYSLRLNGLPIVSENISEEESNKIFSEVNSILNTEGGTTDIDKVTDSVSEALDKGDVNGAVQALTDSGFTEESAKEAIVNITEEIDNEDGTNESELVNNELNKNKDGKGKEEKADQAGVVEGSDKSGTEENRSVAGEEDGARGNADQDRRNEEPVVEEKKSKRRISKNTSKDKADKRNNEGKNIVSSNAESEDNQIVKDDEVVPGILKQVNKELKAVNLKSYTFGPAESYEGLGANVTSIPQSEIESDGITKYSNTTQLKNNKFSNKGGNWWAIFHGGFTNMYNIQTGEAFKVDKVSSMIDNKFILKLSQDRRRGFGNDQLLSDTNKVVGSSDMKSSQKEITKPCSIKGKRGGK